MKLILSRKGFDAANGGMPSPILPSGKAVSLPIPSANAPLKLKELKVDGYDISKIIADLGKSENILEQRVHLDPDIDRRSIDKRPQGWRGAFGQVGAAQSHLAKQNVGKGDIFIFFGWFREIELKNGHWQFKPDAPDLHVIYGWLLIDEVLPVHGNEQAILSKYKWLEHHPHLCGIDNPNNTLYLGQEYLPSEICAGMPGYGAFDCVKDSHILTCRGENNRKRSIWKLPLSFLTSDHTPSLTYHGNRELWEVKDDEWVVLRSVGRGQEFVLDTADHPGVIDWVSELFS